MTSSSAPPTASDAIVDGTITHFLANDTCEIDLGRHGKGRLKQEDSLARDNATPLERLPDYYKGQVLRVYLVKHQSAQGGEAHWRVNERWVANNPWPELEKNLPQGRTVTGRVYQPGPGGWFVRLDTLDIEAWLPERAVPWANGGTQEEVPPDATGRPQERLSIEVGDAIRANVIALHRPPEYPAISINRLLERRARSESTTIPAGSAGSDPMNELAYRAHVEPGQWAQLRARLRQQQPLAGKHLLLVDDNLPALEALAPVLRANGAEIETLHCDGKGPLKSLTGIEAALRERIGQAAAFDLILLDFSLPHPGEGLSLARKLRQSHDGVNRIETPIILYTGEVEPIPQVAEVQCLLRKPIRLDALSRCLEGETLWQGEGLAVENLAVDSAERQWQGATQPATETPDSLLAEWLHRERRLRYLVLLRPLSKERLLLDRHHGGPFPQGEELDKAVPVTGLHSLLKGRERSFCVKPHEGGNEALRRYASYARFASLGAGIPPAHILGLGWDGGAEQPFTEPELDAFCILLRARLEQAALLRWAEERMPYMVLGQVFAGLGHEIRNRFAPWVNHQETLRLAWGQYQGVSGERQQAIGAILETALRGMEEAQAGLSELVELMLTRLRTRRGATPLKEVWADLGKLFAPVLHQRGIRYLPQGEPPTLTLGLPALYLVQPVSNLLLNVYKHMHRRLDGWVKLSCDLAPDGASLLISVEDNGPGIPEAVRPRLFDPGFSLAADACERSGMGLYISRLLVEQVKGELQLDWAWRGVGSRFVLRLPLNLEEA